MATIQHTNTATDGAIVYTWTGMANNDVGSAIFINGKHHLTAQVYGTFNAERLSLTALWMEPILCLP